MKWIGQHIWDFISRFRNKVYFENLEGGSSTTALVVDSEGRVFTNTLSAGGNGEAAKVRLPVRFDEVGGVLKGDPVYIKDYHGSTGPVIVAKADANVAAQMPAFGLADADYSRNADGYAISIGNLVDLDTSSYSIGDTLYVANGGGLTNTKPTTQANLIQNVGTVARINANNGQVEVVATGRSNDVPNLNDGYIFHGNASNQSVPTLLSSLTASTHIGNLTGDVTSVNRATTIANGVVGTDKIADDAVTIDKLADSINSVIAANTAKDTNVSTNLTYTTASDQMTIVSSDGTNVVIAEASGSIAGVMTVAHHDKLDGIEDSATADQTKSDIDALGIAAQTAVSLTAGNKTINGNLIVTAGTSGDATLTLKADTDNSNEADNPYVAFEQDGAGVTAQIGFSGGNNEYPDASTCTGAITNALIVGATGTGAARKVQIATQNTARVTVLDTGLVGIGTNAPAYELDVTGDLSVSGNVLPGITTIKILPRDFIADDGGRPLAIDDTGPDRWLESHSTNPMFASVEIPPGFAATHVDIYGNGTSAVTVYEANINARAVTSKGTGNIGTQINITDVTSNATNYLLIQLVQASGEQVNGGEVRIVKV